MEKCKYCPSEKFVKNGFVRGVQRYRCGHCGKNQITGDRREKHDNKTRGQALAMHLHSGSLRSIGRTLKVPHQSVSKWMEDAGKIATREVQNLHMTPRNISLLEMHELLAYLQKRSAKHEYGWLLIGREAKLLRLTRSPR